MEYFDEDCGYNGCPNAQPSNVPTVSSNDNFAYGVFQQSYGDVSLFSTMTLAPNGLLAIGNPETFPYFPARESVWYYYPWLVKADPSGHLATLLYSEYEPPWGTIGPYQLASYTINAATDDISSSNTWENMPIPDITNITNISMSTSGKLLAVFGYPGLQIFHFNGAAPITSYTKVLLPTTDIDQVAWDNNNHLYAVSYESQKLYVYNVTPTSVSEVAGSPITVSSPYGSLGLTAVPKP